MSTRSLSNQTAVLPGVWPGTANSVARRCQSSVSPSRTRRSGTTAAAGGKTLFERHARHDLFKQRHLPVGQLWRRRGLLGADERRVTDRRDDARAGPGHDRGRRSGVVAVPVREEDLRDLDFLVSGSREAAEQVEDGLVVAGRARVDQGEPVALTDRVSVDEIGA
jgi:hypothetical protein